MAVHWADQWVGKVEIVCPERPGEPPGRRREQWIAGSMPQQPDSPA
ncbi:hypothetical protein OG754_01320 [Streptomyces decoyicus]|nr:hypothetical protein [Streptomyces decoyicus]